jgi:DNA polymerase-3 subunit epsilon
MTILDLETTGLDPKNGEIIQIGILSVLVNQEAGGIIRVLDSYEGLAEPKEQLQPKVVEVTGLTNDMLRGQRIDWPKVLHLLNRTDIAICHNSTFDRQYLECAAPAEIQERVKQLAFGCTLNGINWTARGFQSRKLVDLNRRIGYIYNAHNALNDCKATLNLLVAVPGALEELMNDVHEPKALLCALGTDYNQSDLLRKQNFNWSPEAHGWCKYLSSAQVPVYQQWLTTRLERCYIGIVPGVTAEDRYSPRVHVKLAEQLKTLGLFTEKQDSRTKRKVDQDVVLDAECSL